VAALVVLGGAVAGLWYAVGDPHHFFDLRIYRAAIRWWDAGHPLYDYAQPDRVQGSLSFTYPPVAALLLWPVAQLPLPAAAAAMSLLSLAALGVVVAMLAGPLARRHGLPGWFAGTAAVILVSAIEPVRETIWFGQVSLLITALVLGDLLRPGARRSRWTGIGVGLATAVKLYPGIFIIHLLVTRQWRAAATAAGTATGATLLAAAVAPATSWRYWTQALWDTDRVGRLDYTGNQSLRAALSRAAAPQAASVGLWLVLVAVVLGYGLWRAARLAARGADLAAVTVTGFVGALVSPITWAHHITWFIPALIVLAAAGLRRPPWWLLAAVVYAVAAYGVVTFVDWGPAVRVGDPWWVHAARNLYLPAMLAVVALLPAEHADEPSGSSRK
jgi:alpha-1,2-mannosyltransferase